VALGSPITAVGSGCCVEGGKGGFADVEVDDRRLKSASKSGVAMMI
jgi:hypothetical protein